MDRCRQSDLLLVERRRWRSHHTRHLQCVRYELASVCLTVSTVFTERDIVTRKLSSSAIARHLSSRASSSSPFSATRRCAPIRTWRTRTLVRSIAKNVQENVTFVHLQSPCWQMVVLHWRLPAIRRRSSRFRQAGFGRCSSFSCSSCLASTQRCVYALEKCIANCSL